MFILNKFKVTLCHRYEYFSKDDAAYDYRNKIEDGFVLKESYETVDGTWIFEFEKRIL